MTTVHAFTADQDLLDLPRTGRSERADLRRMRVAPLSIVPTTTGATWAVSQVLPQLAGAPRWPAVRVPVPDGSVVDLVASLRGEVGNSDEVNRAFAEAAGDATYRDVLQYTEQPIVSADVVGNPASCTFSVVRHYGRPGGGRSARLVRQRVGVRGAPGRPCRAGGRSVKAKGGNRC